MTDDIVERLDRKRLAYYTNDTGGAVGMGPVLAEAADEINRLRNQVCVLTERAVFAEAYIKQFEGATDQPSAATENPEAMYSPVARESHAGASARQIDVAAGAPPSACNHFPGQSTCEWCGAVQPERCCLDYPRCDCNSPPEPDNLPCGHPASLLLRSAETGEPLYCELCDDKSGRRDAEQREVELGAALREADELLRHLNLDPERYRTECGFLNLPKITAALKHPDQYPRLTDPTTEVQK